MSNMSVNLISIIIDVCKSALISEVNKIKQMNKSLPEEKATTPRKTWYEKSFEVQIFPIGPGACALRKTIKPTSVSICPAASAEARPEKPEHDEETDEGFKY